MGGREGGRGIEKYFSNVCFVLTLDGIIRFSLDLSCDDVYTCLRRKVNKISKNIAALPYAILMSNATDVEPSNTLRLHAIAKEIPNLLRCLFVHCTYILIDAFSSDYYVGCVSGQLLNRHAAKQTPAVLDSVTSQWLGYASSFLFFDYVSAVFLLAEKQLGFPGVSVSGLSFSII